jgi:hypothetical protein
MDENQITKNIQETETALRIKFPAPYVERMLRKNGGTIATPDGPFTLYPVGPSNGAAASDVVRATKELKKIFTFPNDGIAIAANEAGDNLIFVKEYYHSDKLKNGVFFWSRKIGYIKRVAEDFSKLVETEEKNHHGGSESTEKK